MKSCPTCNRTYADDAFTFCLDDGALLSPPYDPQSTLLIHATRENDPPPTEILRPPARPTDPTPAPHTAPYTAPQHATARAADPFGYPQQAVATSLHQKPGSKTRIAVAGVIVLLTAGVLVLGYFLWRNNQNASPEASKTDANVQSNNATDNRAAPINRNINVNTGPGDQTKPAPSSQWLEGVWEGTGTQLSPKVSWTIKLTAENNSYVIDYPSLRCRGYWTLVELGDGQAKFKESITRGLERCTSDGEITLEKISDSQVSYKYTLPFLGEVATATLTRASAR